MIIFPGFGSSGTIHGRRDPQILRPFVWHVVSGRQTSLQRCDGAVGTSFGQQNDIQDEVNQ